MIFYRFLKVYLIIGKTFSSWFKPIVSGFLLAVLRLIITTGRTLDHLFYNNMNMQKNPIIIVGNPRSGTTFLHRFLIKNRLGTGSQLWQLIYPSVIIQKFIKPFLPILEKFSPARHHSTVAHKTSLTSYETDDVSFLFRYFDGFFLYGFFLSFSDEDLFYWIDPNHRDTSARDFEWLKSVWERNLFSNQGERYIGKLFSIAGNLPKFQFYFPDAKILYMIRDPLHVIPSGLSLITGVLDKRFRFWSLKKPIRDRFIQRLYVALVELLNRFFRDWESNKIDKRNVLIIPFNEMMENFEIVMDNVLSFLEVKNNENMKKEIFDTAHIQRNYKSKHNYSLSKFGLTESQIRNDCENIYKTFFSDK